jgi:FtsP/CotA-like multicopper oxidase with cupredoxin domain
MTGLSRTTSRRAFLGVGGGALICTLGGRTVALNSHADVREADAYAAKLKRPKRAHRDPVDSLRFGTPQPQPGGVVREYWIEAKSVRWDVAPTGHDDWMDVRIPPPTKFRAFAYRQFNDGFAQPIGPPSIPGPILEAEVGDVLRVHFRNADEHFDQVVTMHPHGVRYTPDYDGAYLGEYTRIGGFIEPGEEFTYTWEATPDSVGVWPYHDHGPNHVINSHRGLFGAIIVREKGAKRPDVEQVLVFHDFDPTVTGLRADFQCVNGRRSAGNTPTVRAKVGQDVAFHVYGANDMLHTFHMHGHRWGLPTGFTDNVLLGPEVLITARWTEDNPGRWLYHCHVLAHMEAGMNGWYLVEP